LFADSPEDFASAVVRVLTDARLARELGAQEAATVRERFGWGNVAMRFSLICQNALQEFQQQKGKAVSAERRDAIA
jgi:glycosyltransferase involved in cell wall biosynthesis